MGTFSRSDEFKPLLKEKNTSEKWNQKLFKWSVIKIVLGILVVGLIVYFAYSFTKSANQQDPYETVKAKKSSLHISSTVPSNNDYFKQCAPVVKCDPSAKYRSVNGSCNNLEVPTRGAAITPFLRLLKAAFDDGFYEPRKQTDGSALPNPRIINTDVFLGRDMYKVDDINVLLMPFAQLLAHDISGLIDDVLIDKNGSVRNCCTDKKLRETYPQCKLAIKCPPDDPVYSKLNVSCMAIYRSRTSRNYSCPLYPTTFINSNTHFIDASEVYGSEEDVANRLRLMEGGRLNFSTTDNGQMFCPFLPNAVKDYKFNPTSKTQFDTGNPPNGNQNLGITAMQTLFLRYHNFIAFKLSSINPGWSDEKLYQEARRIVIATIQKIAYEDFLPLVIGNDFQEAYGINEENIYDPTVNPAMSIELSSAGFRALHSLIPSQFNLMDKNYSIESAVTITDWMTNPALLIEGNNYDMFFKGFLETPGRKFQPSYNFDVSNYVFTIKFGTLTFRLDLVSLDLLRSRDVGLQSYNQVRQLCGLPLAKNFEDLADLIHIEAISKLKKHYHSVDDIDLGVGLILEKPSDGALVGPTTQCLIADGFYRAKAGDRFFYDVQGQPGSFTPGQLKVIKKLSFGHVLCATTNVDRVQNFMFKALDHNLFPTLKLKCDDGFYIDFDNWVEPTNCDDIKCPYLKNKDL